jgi:competence protein ComFC
MSAESRATLATATLSRLGDLALDLLYPRHCLLCRKGGVFLCGPCLDGLPLALGARCEACWLPFTGGPCRRCREYPLSLGQVRSVFRYEGDVRRLVHAFKFRYVSALADSLAGPMASLAAAAGVEVDALVPVPLSAARERERGFNQALLLARSLGGELTIPVLEALRRRRSGPTQALSASAAERRLNVAGRFDLRKDAIVAGMRLLLIDDVATTCATLDACARVLLAAGASEVAALTFARED